MTQNKIEALIAAGELATEGKWFDKDPIQDRHAYSICKVNAQKPLGQYLGNRKFITQAANARQEVKEMYAEVQRLRAAAAELLEVAEMRGDNDLPHPADDAELWTARMQDAWHDLEDALAKADALNKGDENNG